jgi:dihydrofolate synthase/folylpolyglutamate synthase
MISRSYVTRFIEKYRYETEKIQPSFFELTVGLAFDYFRDQQVDIAVVEVGLGGRLDSTNIIQPLLSVITNVSFDHTQFLGTTLDKIAFEKAGIIKPGIPIIIGETHPETNRVFKSIARQRKSRITFADQLFSISQQCLTGRYNDHRVISIDLEDEPFLTNLILPLAGQYQLKNILTVVATCEQLNGDGLSMSESHVYQGVANVIVNTGLKGRWQILGKNPLTICDTGHNEGGLQEVLSQIASTPHQFLHFVFGVVNDKQLEPIFALLPKDAHYYFCKPDIPRGLDASVLHSQATIAGLTGEAYASVKEALKIAREKAASNDLVFVGGSTFVVAEVV